MKNFNIPPTYFFATSILIIASFFIWPEFNLINIPYNFTGIILLILGLNFAGKGSLLFKKKGTTKRFDKSTSLVVEGIYSKTRNPMYLGMISFLFGLAVIFQNLIGFIFPLIFLFIIQLKFIAFEERKMETTFGKDYLAYKKAVRRWF